MAEEDEEVWEEEDGDEVWVWVEVLGGGEVLEEDIMVVQEDIYSTIQPISKIIPHLMYTFIRRRHPM